MCKSRPFDTLHRKDHSIVTQGGNQCLEGTFYGVEGNHEGELILTVVCLKIYAEQTLFMHLHRKIQYFIQHNDAIIQKNKLQWTIENSAHLSEDITVNSRLEFTTFVLLVYLLQYRSPKM
jgi:hypothetical protein